MTTTTKKKKKKDKKKNRRKKNKPEDVDVDTEDDGIEDDDDLVSTALLLSAESLSPIVDAYVVPLMDSAMIDSKEGMEPPPSLIVCIMCSMKDKEIVELKDRLHTLREEEKGVKAYIDEMDAKWTRRMEKVEVSNDQLKTSNDQLRTSHNELRTNNAKQSEEISSLKKSFAATYRFSLKLLIYDVRMYIKKKLSREPSVGADNTVLWDDFLNSLTPTDLLVINMDQGLIQFIQNEMPFCNSTAHKSDKVLVAATLQNMSDSISKSNWVTLFSTVYDGESPEDVIRRS